MIRSAGVSQVSVFYEVVYNTCLTCDHLYVTGRIINIFVDSVSACHFLCVATLKEPSVGFLLLI